MRISYRAVLELSLACLALAGTVVCWLHSHHTVSVAPIVDGQPVTTSVNYDPWPLGLTFFLASLAGALLVVGGARMRRARRSLPA